MSDNSATANDGTNDSTNATTDEASTSSLFSNLTNKLKYNLHKAVYDPNANKFIEEQAKKKDSTNNTTTDTNTDVGTSSDPNKFSAKRLAKKVGSQTLDILKKVFFPFIALMLAMIIANELIIYAAPIRIVFFIFTLALCMYSGVASILLSLYYIFKGGYSYYVNHMTDGPKRDIMPTIFALLPITTYQPLSSFVGFFMYPFTYPKTERGKLELPNIMQRYWQALVRSFKDFDKIKNMEPFVEDIKSIQYNLTHLHNLSSSAINVKITEQNDKEAKIVMTKEANKSPEPSAPPAPPALSANNNPN